MTDHVRIEDADGVRTIRFTRPDKKNALTRAMYTAAAEALESADADPSVRVCILTGSDGVFTAGNDLMDFMEAPPDMSGGDTPPVQRFMHAIYLAKKPLIAAVDGIAVGIGTTLLLHCDLVYASEQAQFKTPFVDLALAPEFGSSQTFVSAFGRAPASELLLLGAVWDARRAYEAGMVTAVTTPDALEETALAAARNLAAKAPGAVRKAKELITMAPDDLMIRIKIEGAAFTEMLHSDEFKEAATAFMERRAPDFSKFG